MCSVQWVFLKPACFLPLIFLPSQVAYMLYFHYAIQYVWLLSLKYYIQILLQDKNCLIFGMWGCPFEVFLCTLFSFSHFLILLNCGTVEIGAQNALGSYNSQGHLAPCY